MSAKNVIELPTSDAPAEIRESFRAVLASHGFVVMQAEPVLALDAIERSEVLAAGDQDGGDQVDELRGMVRTLLDARRQRVIVPDRFESLLVELGNNAMQRLHMLAINRDLDERDDVNSWEPHLADLRARVGREDWLGAAWVLTRLMREAIRRADGRAPS